MRSVFERLQHLLVSGLRSHEFGRFTDVAKLTTQGRR